MSHLSAPSSGTLPARAHAVPAFLMEAVHAFRSARAATMEMTRPLAKRALCLGRGVPRTWRTALRILRPHRPCRPLDTLKALRHGAVRHVERAGAIDRGALHNPVRFLESLRYRPHRS